MTEPMALVTGAPGWLGTRLARTLIEGLPDVPALAQGSPDRPVRCLTLRGQDVSSLASISGNIEIIEGDLRDAESVASFTRDAQGATLFHSAGVIHPARRVKEFYEVNVQGTKNLLEAAEKAGIRRFIHVSSNSPLGCNASPADVFDESSPYHPYLNYGRSKRLAEDLVNAASTKGRLQTVIVRPPWFYGPDQPERQSLFFSMIRGGKMPIVGSGENLRSMAYVDNICQGLMLCEQVDEASGQTYWIADRAPYCMNEIVDTIERLIEVDFGLTVAHKRLRLPGFVSEIALALDKCIQRTGFYHQKMHVLSEMNKTIACSIEKARKELGYDPKIELEEGMRRSIQWMLDQGIHF